MSFRHKTLLLFFICLFPITSFADSAAQALVQILDNLQTVQAQFTQTVLDGQGRSLQQTSGAMTMQRPGKFRWETSKPSQQLLIADGKQIWFYDVDLQQVTVQKQQVASKNSPAMLLSGSPERLAQEFLITQQGSTFKLMPKSKEGLFRSVQLVFSDQTLVSMQLIDNLGQVTKVQFSQVQNNPAISPSLFVFKVPAGVDVVRQ